MIIGRWRKSYQIFICIRLSGLIGLNDLSWLIGSIIWRKFVLFERRYVRGELWLTHTFEGICLLVVNIIRVFNMNIFSLNFMVPFGLLLNSPACYCALICSIFIHQLLLCHPKLLGWRHTIEICFVGFNHLDVLDNLKNALICWRLGLQGAINLLLIGGVRKRRHRDF